MFVIYANDNYIFQHSKASATHAKLSNQAKQVNQADLATHVLTGNLAHLQNSFN